MSDERDAGTYLPDFCLSCFCFAYSRDVLQCSACRPGKRSPVLVPHLAGNDGTRMQGAPKSSDETKGVPVGFAPLRYRLDHSEIAVDAARILDPALDRPGYDYLVANIFVHLATMLQDRPWIID